MSSRGGIYGMALDSTSGKKLDEVAVIVSAGRVRRERATFLGFQLPWGEPDERLRERAFAAILQRFYEESPEGRAAREIKRLGDALAELK